MSPQDNCKIKPGRWGLYVHHECNPHLKAQGPEYINGTFKSRDKSIGA